METDFSSANVASTDIAQSNNFTKNAFLASPVPAHHYCYVDYNAQIKAADIVFSVELLSQHHLIVSNGTLLPALQKLRDPWLEALRYTANTHKESLFALKSHPKLISVGLELHEDSELICVRLQQERLCSAGSVNCYAQLVRLTPRESLVLDLLAQGLAPADVANELNTRESTVRTQIKSILAKSEHTSIRELLVTLACLPPIGLSTAIASQSLQVSSAVSA